MTETFSHETILIKNTVLQRAQALLDLDGLKREGREFTYNAMSIFEEAILNCHYWKIVFLMRKKSGHVFHDIPVDEIIPLSVKRVFNVLHGIKDKDFTGLSRGTLVANDDDRIYFHIASFFIDKLNYFEHLNNGERLATTVRGSRTIEEYESIIEGYKKL